ncbi:MAG: hypothetical protein R3Y43_07910 [Alphaproteobacteria bacterium]
MSFMEKYNLTEVATTGSVLTLADYKDRIVNLIDYNIKVINNQEEWDGCNRMKKLLTEDKKNNKIIFAIRFNSRTVVRLSGLNLPNDFMKVQFLQDAKQSILMGEFDGKIEEFMRKAQENQEARKLDKKKRKALTKETLAQLKQEVAETSITQGGC